jgi:molecular chaperone DnaJ
MPKLHGLGKGDQLVKVGVVVPTRLSARERELLTELRGIEDKTPTKGEKKHKGIFGKVKDAFV